MEDINFNLEMDLVIIIDINFILGGFRVLVVFMFFFVDY